MENREAFEKLERQSKLICHGCMHPSMVGWCENHCQLPEAFNMALSALEKQEAKQPEMVWDKTFDCLKPVCPTCKTLNPRSVNYCWKCGQRIKAEEET